METLKTKPKYVLPLLLLGRLLLLTREELMDPAPTYTLSSSKPSPRASTLAFSHDRVFAQLYLNTFSPLESSVWQWELIYDT